LRDASGNEVYGYGSVREASFLEGAGARVRELYQASIETAVGSARLKLNAGINDSATNWYVTPGTSAATTRNGGPGTLTSTPMRLYFSDAQLTVTPTPNQVLVVGAAWRGESADTKDRSLSDWRNEETTGSTTYRAGGKSQTFAPFVQDEITFAEKFTASLGLRWDYWQAYDGYADSVGMAGYPMQYATRTEHELSPKFGLVYRANADTSLRTSVGHAFRAPTVYELFRTRTTGGITYYSNPDLKPETVNSWDVGGDFHPWKGAAIKPTFYVYEVRDLIYRRTISSTEKEYINAGRAKGKGFELDVRQQLPHGWTVLAGGAINKTKIIENKASPDSEGKQFENVPERTGHLGVMWRQHAWSFTGLARYVSKRYAEDDNSDTTNNVQGSFDPYTVVDLKLGYQIDKNLKLSLSIDNALNRDYYAYYQAPGRSYFVEVSGQF
jgi:iron complex outermembrane receptor protein